MKAMIWTCMLLGVVALLVAPLPAVAQDHGDGGGGGGGGGCGDVFGDLIHIKRDDMTGQPILAKRWVELPKEAPGYGWGYCPIAVDEFGNELGFAPLSCDVDPADLDRVEDTDYFGRLNGGRTKERNQRMHFNEVIDNIKASCRVEQEETGRLKIGYCDDDGELEEWAVIDSPMESMGLYVRLMKYGHIQTDPDEEDYWAHGDPATGPQLQPALGPEDWLKFDESAQHLLPGWYEGRVLPAAGETLFGNEWITSCFTDFDGDDAYSVLEPFTDTNKDGLYDPPVQPDDPGEPFIDLDDDGVRDEESEPFDSSCAAPHSLTNQDFIRAGSFMGGAANKTGWITRDLVQYFNRIVKITKVTAHTAATPHTLPALVRICEVVGDLSQAEDQAKPTYSSCTDNNPADESLDNAGLFPDVLERFVDFGAVDYVRLDWRDETIEGVFPLNDQLKNWRVYSQELGWVVPLVGWLESANGNVDAYDIDGFVGAASDALRAVEFVHNHATPVNLWLEFEAVRVPE